MKAFPLTFRNDIKYNICSDCLEQGHGQSSRQYFDWWITERKKMQRKNSQAAYHRRKNTHFSEEVLSGIKQIFDFKCAACHRHEGAVKLTIDHVVPLSNGGSKKPENVQILCWLCNIRKSTGNTDYRTLEQIAKLKVLY